jgi:glycosyltransferase involved in cell wall biosynthesis
MKVTLINTSDAGGGAPAACMRLLKALEAKRIDAGLDVQEKKTNEPRVTGTVSKLRARINLLAERLPFIWFKAKDRSVRFAFSTANTGTDISTRPEILSSDIFHLHWTNFGFLSINDIEQLFKTGKPIIWTLHDMWAFTGGCHYSADCDHFLNECGDCWMLKNPGTNDISHTDWIEKAAMYGAAKNIVFITCSNWLAEVARTSSLLKDFRIEAIPNPIDTAIFAPADKASLRVKWNINPTAKVILFGAANILDRRKGFSYLVEALNELKDNVNAAAIEIVIFGKNKSFDVNQLPFKAHELGTINSEQGMAEVYNLADVFVNPTIEDNLPNTVMEALSCGVPVVAFNTGGVPDMVDHLNNGYLAAYKSSPDLATGISWVFTAGTASGLAANARKKVLENFAGNIVASKYIAVYNSVLKK